MDLDSGDHSSNMSNAYALRNIEELHLAKDREARARRRQAKERVPPPYVTLIARLRCAGISMEL